MRRNLLIAVVSCLVMMVSSAAQAYHHAASIAQNALPQQAKAFLGADGEISVRWSTSQTVYMTTYREEKRVREVEVDGKQEQQEYTVKVPATLSKQVSVTNVFSLAPDKAAFFDLEGKPVAKDKVAAALEKEATILFATQAVPNSYLTIFKPGTLLLVVEPERLYAAPPGIERPAPGETLLNPVVPAPAAPVPVPPRAVPVPAPAPAVPPADAPPFRAPIAPGGPLPAPHAQPTVSLAKAGKDALSLRKYAKEVSRTQVLYSKTSAKGEPETYSANIETESLVDIETRYPNPVVKVYRVDGKDVPAADVAKLLAASRAVLVSTDGQKVDKSYLEIVKPDTLIVVPPNPTPPAMGASAPSPAAFDPYAIPGPATPPSRSSP